MKLKKCFVRFEPNIDGGTMFLFNKENGQMLEGDYYTYIIVRSLIDNVDMEELAKNIASENKWSLSKVQNDIEIILDVLSQKGYIDEE